MLLLLQKFLKTTGLKIKSQMHWAKQDEISQKVINLIYREKQKLQKT